MKWSQLYKSGEVLFALNFAAQVCVQAARMEGE